MYDININNQLYIVILRIYTHIDIYNNYNNNKEIIITIIYVIPEYKNHYYN